MYSVYQEQGARDYMEDTVDYDKNIYNNMSFYAIFDGHGGAAVSKFLQSNFRPVLKEFLTATRGDVEASLKNTFAALANRLENEPLAKNTGSTAIVLIKEKRKLWLANAGDCRAVLKYFDENRYKSKQMTVDHKPNIPSEIKRIKEANGFISQDPWGTWRVGGNLAVSRSLGDTYLAPWVTWVPDIYVSDIDDKMRAVIIASDGVWDTLSNNNVVDIAEQIIKTNMLYDQKTIMDKITKTICKEAQRKGSGDNISVFFIIV